MDIVTLGAALSGAKKYTDDVVQGIAGGITYKGEVNYYSNLPSNPTLGDAYTVKYSGTTGSIPDGTEYVWAENGGVAQWVDFSKDAYTKAETDALLNNKQNVLTVGTNLDDEPIKDSTNPITSGGVYNTVGNLDAALDSLIMSLEPKTITANGTYNPADDGVDGYSEVTVNVGGSVAKKDVNFYGYDGTVVASYTASEFAELTAMPANPTHTGLTAQGWNWSLSDAKTYVATYTKLNIGQMYITSDGKTRLYIELTEGRLQPWLRLWLNKNTELDIDWGDGSTHSTFNSASGGYASEMHTYANAGSYVIAITVVSGSFFIRSGTTSYSQLLTNNDSSASSPNKAYEKSIYKVEIGNGVAEIGSGAFVNCVSLSTISLPNTITIINESAFRSCYSLESIVIPNSVTSINFGTFGSCYSLESIVIPNSVTSIGNSAFSGCQSLPFIVIPNSVTSIGNNAFDSCNALCFAALPSSISSVGNGAFGSCYSLATITINKPEDSISGSPWGASTTSPTSTQIVWTG